jgi:hypothetical protein
VPLPPKHVRQRAFATSEQSSKDRGQCPEQPDESLSYCGFHCPCRRKQLGERADPCGLEIERPPAPSDCRHHHRRDGTDRHHRLMSARDTSDEQTERDGRKRDRCSRQHRRRAPTKETPSDYVQYGHLKQTDDQAADPACRQAHSGSTHRSSGGLGACPQSRSSMRPIPIPISKKVMPKPGTYWSNALGNARLSARTSRGSRGVSIPRQEAAP